MPQSLAQVDVHMVFSTKNRRPWLQDDNLRDQLYAYMATILRDNVDSPALIINGVEDHLHVLMRLSRRFAVLKIVQECKTETSKWLKRQMHANEEFAGRQGTELFSFGAFLVERREALHARISNQHHARHVR